jgi:hypothetical protein
MPGPLLWFKACLQLVHVLVEHLRLPDVFGQSRVSPPFVKYLFGICVTCERSTKVSTRGIRGSRIGITRLITENGSGPCVRTEVAGLTTSRDGTPWESRLGLFVDEALESLTLLGTWIALDPRDTLLGPLRSDWLSRRPLCLLEE